jgi:two-component system sensor histidine kinase YesM
VLKRWFRDMKLQTKFTFLIFSCVGILCAAFIWASFRLADTYNEMIYKRTADALTFSAENLASLFQTNAELSRQIATNETIQQALVTARESEDQIARKAALTTLGRQLTGYSNHNRYIECIHLDYGGASSLILGKRTITDTEKNQEEIHAAANSQQGAYSFLVLEDMDGQPQLVCTRTIRRVRNMDLSELGVLTLYLDLDKMVKDSVTSFARIDNTALYLAHGQQAIYPYGDAGVEQYLSNSGDTSYRLERIGGVMRFIVQKPISSTPYTCILAPAYSEIFRTLVRNNILCAVIVLAVVALTVAFSHLFVRNLLRHLGTLIEKINYYKGNAGQNHTPASSYDYTQRHDELGMLHNEFDDMVCKINTLIEDNYIKQLLIKDTQLKALQQQINPHFLYNTLNAINWEAEALNAPTIPAIVESLSALLRSTLSEKSETLPLQNELELLHHYLRIQQIRYGDRLVYHTDIMPSLLPVPVPKMILQPLVENAIRYSLEPYADTCTILVSAQQKNETCAVISVSNTGSEIDPDILKKLESGEITPNGFGIGLLNIHSRIQLLFGDAYGLSFSNSDNIATVEILVPLSGH